MSRTPPTLSTGRLILRPFVPEDVDDLWRTIMHDPEVMATLSLQPQTLAEEQACAAQYIDCYSEPCAQKGYGGWAVTARTDDLAPTGTLLGFCGFERGQIEGEGAEIGYGYGQAYWGKGLGLEAASHATAWYFGAGGHDRFYACYDPGNEGSKRILETIGLTYSRHLDLWGSVARGLGKLPVLTINREDWARKQE